MLQLAGGATPRFVDDLGKVKDAIGEWHDWEELASIARPAGTDLGSDRDAGGLEGIQHEEPWGG